VNSRCKWDSRLQKMPSFKIGTHFTGRDGDVKRVQACFGDIVGLVPDPATKGILQ